MLTKTNPVKFIPVKFTLITLLLFVTSFLVYLLSSAGPTPYNYFVYLSEAFLQGKSYLTNPPPWLNELIPASSGKYFVAYPPFPSLLLLPFVLLFGATFPQQYLAHLLGAATVSLTYLLARRLSPNPKLALFSSLLIGFGTIIWYLSSVGSAWYLSQLSACFFITVALYFSLSPRTPFISGLSFAAAYLSRLQTILLLPLFLFLPKGHLKKSRPLVRFLLPVFFALLTNAFYNFSRFGTLWDKGYLLIPGVLNEPWYQKGLFHFSYLPRHLKIIFWSFPHFSSTPPFLTPSWSGLALWITTPAFIYALFAPLNKTLTRVSWLSILLISIPILTHGTTGFTQFGYRFAVDFYPILLFLTLQGVIRTGLKWHHWLLLTLSIIVNFWGVLCINQLGAVSF